MDPEPKTRFDEFDKRLETFEKRFDDVRFETFARRFDDIKWIAAWVSGLLGLLVIAAAWNVVTERESRGRLKIRCGRMSRTNRGDSINPLVKF